MNILDRELVLLGFDISFTYNGRLIIPEKQFFVSEDQNPCPASDQLHLRQDM